jgi:hypothetical protein
VDRLDFMVELLLGMSVCLFLCLSVPLPFSMSLYVSLCLSVRPSVVDQTKIVFHVLLSLKIDLILLTFLYFQCFEKVVICLVIMGKGQLLEIHLLEKSARHQNRDCSTAFEQIA